MSQVEVVRREPNDTVTEMLFSVSRSGHQIPALAWLPTGRQHTPVVPFGHGGSGHKAMDRHHRLTPWLVAGTGVACPAIDGPYQRDRAVPGDSPLDYQERVVAEGAVAVRARTAPGLADRAGCDFRSLGAQW